MAFDRERFKQLVLYISWKTRDIEDFDRIKLAKVLFYSDLCAFAETGEALTWAEYRHYPHGPFPEVLASVENELHNNGEAVVERLLPEGRQPDRDGRKIIPEKEPPAPAPELAYMVDNYINKIAALKTWDVKKASHEHPGWHLTGDGDTIPYHVALMSRRRPTDRDYARVRELALQHGWD